MAYTAREFLTEITKLHEKESNLGVVKIAKSLKSTHNNSMQIAFNIGDKKGRFITSKKYRNKMYKPLSSLII